jgi:hypothetical protein
MARRLARSILVVSAVLAALLAIAAAFRFYESEPMDDMRPRADALPLPKDFVLVSESYSPGALGWFGSVPHLQRVYHASWPGLCDLLRELSGRVGKPTGLAPVPKPYADQMCNCGASHPSGWLGWIRNYRHYEVRFTAWRPGSAQGPMFETPRGFIALYPRPGPVLPDQRIVIPEGRARVEVELIAHRGW